MERTLTKESLADVVTRARLEKMVVDESNVGQFIKPNYCRNIRNSIVRKIVSSFAAMRHFDDPVVVNKIDSTYRIIDGNHRFTAVREYLEKNPGNSVEVPLSIYENLSEPEEKEIFDMLSDVAKQTLNDFIKIHFDEIPIFKRIENSFPITVNIYSTQEAISFANLFKAWMSRQQTNKFFWSDRQTFLNRAKNIPEREYHDMKDYFNKFLQIYGTPGSSNPYYKKNVLWCIMSIYFANIGVINESTMWEILRKKTIGNIKLIELSRYSSDEMALELRRDLVAAMNRGNRGNKLV
jgi:hypothetical protein